MRRLNDRSEMQAPGICFVCECAPQADVVDTNANFTAGFPSSLEGRKYICRGCVEGAAVQLGLVSAEARDKAMDAAVVADAKRVAVLDAVREFAQAVVDGSLEDIADRVVVFAEDSPPAEAPDLVNAQDVVADAEPVEPNEMSKVQAQVKEPKPEKPSKAEDVREDA